MLSITPELIQKFDVSGPRYTSYPTADRFVDAFGMQEHVLALEQHKLGVGRMSAPLSLYIHIPFCESLCYFCACNKKVTKHHESGKMYLLYLLRELDLVIDYLGAGRALGQLHLGGGTPTFLADEDLATLFAAIQRNFNVLPQNECSIEVDPRTVDAERLRKLHELGFNRLSFGVQDFDPIVQKAVHRIQSSEMVKTLMEDARSIGFQAINIDLIYGLPKQNPESFRGTIEQVIYLRPDRIALYAYAHLPERFKPQRRINADELPAAKDKLAMHSNSIEQLMRAGYEYVGMDHFALPTDSLAVAKRQGRLHRNFQGYSTQPDCDLVALGVSAIGKMGSTYSQNAKTIEEYYDAIDRGTLPIVKGLSLTHDDALRRAVIMAIMCQGYLDFESIELAHLIDFKSYFAKELGLLTDLEDKGLVIVSQIGLEVTQLGWFFVRGIAMVFDKYYQADRNRATFSKII